MNARDVLAGLKAAEWRRVHGGAMTTRRCPVCHGYAPGDAIDDECGHDEGCAIAAAIQWFEEHVGAEDIRAKTEASLAPVTKALDEAVANAERLLGRPPVWGEGTVIYVDGRPHRLTRAKSGDGRTTELQFVQVPR